MLDKQDVSLLAGVSEDMEIRSEVEAIIQRIKALPSFRERALCITKLQEAVMWLDMNIETLRELSQRRIDLINQEG